MHTPLTATRLLRRMADPTAASNGRRAGDCTHRAWKGALTMSETQEMGSTQDRDAAEVLRKSRTVAVVGISDKEDRDSHKVAKYLKEKGYRIIPVNPKLSRVLGETCYPDLASVPEHIDVVDIFRNVEAIPGIVEEAIQVGADAVWMQLGLHHEEAAGRARERGISVVMNKCMKIEHSKLSTP